MKKQLEQLISKAVFEEFGAVEASNVAFTVSVPPSPEMGDYSTNVAMVVAKVLKKNPQEVGEKIVRKIVDFKLQISDLNTNQDVLSANLQSAISNMQFLGGFINFTLSCEYLLTNLDAVIEQGEKFGASNIGEGKKVIVEYFQNNVAKPPHVGHLRSAVIGDSLKRLFGFLGFEVVSDTHIGDWGVQFGILLHAFKTLGDRSVVEKDPIQELNKLYVLESEKIEKEPELRELGKQEFVKLEQGDAENRKLWQWFVEVSLKDFEEYRQLLGLLPFEYNLGESFYEDKMQEVLDELKSKNLVVTGETGEQYVDLEGDGLGRCILVKSDGGTTYHLRDLATYKYRKDVVHFQKNVYVVDVRQAHHFKQLFKVLEHAGYQSVTHNVHVDFGFMGLPEGAISTRKGNVISLEALMQEAALRARAVIEEKNPALANKEVVARQVALSAIKYFDLSHNRQSNIMFTWDKALSFEGNTGPYLQYTCARIHGIVRKSTPRDGEVNGVYKPSEQESAVLRKLILFPETLELAAEGYYPNLLCNYLFELAQTFNKFYETVPVNGEVDNVAYNYKIRLCKATAQVMKNGLGILGIEAPEEM